MDSLCRSGFPDDSFLDHQPYWGEYKNRTRGGTNPNSTTAAERLRLVAGMVRPVLPCVCVGVGSPVRCFNLRRCRGGGGSIVAYHTLPLMHADRQPAGWDRWGQPWALMDIAQYLVPRNGKVWRHAHLPGRVLVAVLVRYDAEPYYFPDAPALLQTLHQNAKAEGDIAAQLGAQGWSAHELKQVEILLRPHTYPPCGALTSCLRGWTQFAHWGDGYREGPAMPGGPDQVAFHTECWSDSTSYCTISGNTGNVYYYKS